MTFKTCRICKAELPLADFHRDKAKAGGYRATCKPCVRQGLNKRPEKIEGMKRCSRCQTYKPLTTEHFVPYPDGSFFNYCRPCYRENKREWWSELPIEARREKSFQTPEYKSAIKKMHWVKVRLDPVRMDAHRAKNRAAFKKAYAVDPHKFIARGQADRAKRQGVEGEFSKADLGRKFADQHGKCAYCGCDVGGRHDGPWNVDHFIPLARGGSNWIENIVIACQFCNLSKGARMPWEFMPSKFSPPNEQVTGQALLSQIMLEI